MYHSIGSRILRVGFWTYKIGTGASLVFIPPHSGPFELILLYINLFLMPRKPTKKQPVAKAPAPTSAPTLAGQHTCTSAQPVIPAVAETPRDLGPVVTDTAVTPLTPEVTDDVVVLRGEYLACLSRSLLSHCLPSPLQLSSLP